MKKKITISFIGNSKKFVKVFKSIYPNAKLNFYSWRLLGNILSKIETKLKSDVVVICGYDYLVNGILIKSINYNVIYPFKFVKMISKKNTIIFTWIQLIKLLKIKD